MESYDMSIVSVAKHCLAQCDTRCLCSIVDESGASIYSASKEAEEELPKFDVTLRGAGVFTALCHLRIFVVYMYMLLYAHIIISWTSFMHPQIYEKSI